MTHSVRDWDRGFDAEALTELATFWNANAGDRHAFYPWTGGQLSRQLTDGVGKPLGKLLTVRSDAGELLGFTHVAQVSEDGYPAAGVLEALLVGRECRSRGIGTALLLGALSELRRFRPRPLFVDAMGAWPFGYVYNVLADGSERSGVFVTRERELYRLLRRAGFEDTRPSLVMRAETSAVGLRPLPEGSGYYIARRTENTWLDRVFRGRELWDHDMARAADGRIMSRSIFGFMEGESAREGRAIFSVFGVNTPADMRDRGYAGANLSHMISYVKELGGEAVELHVYADNEPAVRLYRGLGFRPVDGTMMMHLRSL